MIGDKMVARTQISNHLEGEIKYFRDLYFNSCPMPAPANIPLCQRFGNLCATSLQGFPENHHLATGLSTTSRMRIRRHFLASCLPPCIRRSPSDNPITCLVLHYRKHSCSSIDVKLKAVFPSCGVDTVI